MEVLEAMLWIIIIFLMYKVADYIYRLPRLGGLASKWVLITGCDSGFGNEIAQRLDQLGVHVFAGCLTEKGEADLKAISSTRLITIRIDVSNGKSISKAFDFVSQTLPKGVGLWGLYNNAGIICDIGPFDWQSIEEYQQLLDVNLLGLINTTTTFLPLVKKAKGRIINTSSFGGIMAFPFFVPYCISKYGVECFSDAIRCQLKQFGVSVHIIQPSGYTTNITNINSTQQRMDNLWKNCPPSIKEEYGDRYFQGLKQAITYDMSRSSKKINQVIDAYDHALLSCYPRARYMVGSGAIYVVWLMTFAPEWFRDWFLSKESKSSTSLD